MANLNKVMLIGNLTADPDVRTTPRGTPVTELRIAINRVTSGPNDGERREVAAQYLAKGRPVFIEGRLQQDTWEDKQTGQRRSRIRIIAENLQLLGSRDGAPQSGGNGGYQQQRSGGYNNGGGYGNGGGNYGNNNGGYGNGGGYQRPQYQQQSRPQQAPAPMPAEEEDDIPF